MNGKDKIIDRLPDSFANEEEAGEFWDSHSTMDYVEHLELVDDLFDLQERVFEVQVANDIFQKLRERAEEQDQPIPQIVDEILRDALAVA
jgi:hypothetical protein